MKIEALELPGCVLLLPDVRQDARGYLVKPFLDAEYRAYGLQTGFVEHYYSRSVPGVLRGLHFQIPPHEHSKLVMCVYGIARDVVLDVRRGSPTYGKCHAFDWDARNGSALYLPPGIAHGFLAQTEVIMSYHVTSTYAPTHDGGIRWDSVAVDWGNDAPTVSERDQALPTWQGFDSPFVYRAGENPE